MDEAVVLGVIFITLLVLVALMVKIALFCRAFSEDTRYICRKMDYADSYEEYRRWCGELRCHYLCLIPFVNEKNVMSVYRIFFHKGEHSKTKERKDSLVPLLLPSVLGICLCLVCICGMTWAWYSASLEGPTQKLTAAYYEVSVKSVRDNSIEDSNSAKITADADGSYTLTADKDYTVILQARGTAENRGGYCLIESANTKQYTQTFKPGYEITITLRPTEDGPYTFNGVWGCVSSADAENGIIKANEENKIDDAYDDQEAVHEDDPVPLPVNPSGSPEELPQDNEIPEQEPAAPQGTTPVEVNPDMVTPSDSMQSDLPASDSPGVPGQPSGLDTDASA